MNETYALTYALRQMVAFSAKQIAEFCHAILNNSGRDLRWALEAWDWILQVEEDGHLDRPEHFFRNEEVLRSYVLVLELLNQVDREAGPEEDYGRVSRDCLTQLQAAALELHRLLAEDL